MIKNIYIFIGFLLLAILLVITTSSCTKKVYVPVETISIKTDSIRDIKFHTDSILIRDSVIIREFGDTVTIYKTRDRIKTQIKLDTVLKTLRDTIIKEIPVPQNTNRNVNIRSPTSYKIWLILVIASFVAGFYIYKRIFNRK